MKKNVALLLFFLISSSYAQEIPTLTGKGEPVMVQETT